MNQHVMDMVVARMAEEEGTSADVMNKRLQGAMYRSMQNENESVRNCWRELPCRDGSPTLEDLINYIENKIS